MSEILQIATLISAIVGWLTVIVGGIAFINRLSIRISKLESKLDNLCDNYKNIRIERAECEEREKELSKDHEARIRTLEKG